MCFAHESKDGVPFHNDEDNSKAGDHHRDKRYPTLSLRELIMCNAPGANALRPFNLSAHDSPPIYFENKANLEPVILPASSSTVPYSMHPAWQCFTQLGSFPLATRPAQRSHLSVGTAKKSYCHVRSSIWSGPICFTSMPNLSADNPCSIWHATSHV